MASTIKHFATITYNVLPASGFVAVTAKVEIHKLTSLPLYGIK
jgi:hypothetical protein